MGAEPKLNPEAQQNANNETGQKAEQNNNQQNSNSNSDQGSNSDQQGGEGSNSGEQSADQEGGNSRNGGQDQQHNPVQKGRRARSNSEFNGFVVSDSGRLSSSYVSSSAKNVPADDVRPNTVAFIFNEAQKQAKVWASNCEQSKNSEAIAAGSPSNIWQSTFATLHPVISSGTETEIAAFLNANPDFRAQVKVHFLANWNHYHGFDAESLVIAQSNLRIATDRVSPNIENPNFKSERQVATEYFDKNPNGLYPRDIVAGASEFGGTSVEKTREGKIQHLLDTDYVRSDFFKQFTDYLKSNDRQRQVDAEVITQMRAAGFKDSEIFGSPATSATSFDNGAPSVHQEYKLQYPQYTYINDPVRGYRLSSDTNDVAAERLRIPSIQVGKKGEGEHAQYYAIAGGKAPYYWNSSESESTARETRIFILDPELGKHLYAGKDISSGDLAALAKAVQVPWQYSNTASGKGNLEFQYGTEPIEVETTPQDVLAEKSKNLSELEVLKAKETLNHDSAMKAVFGMIVPFFEIIDKSINDSLYSPTALDIGLEIFEAATIILSFGVSVVVKLAAKGIFKGFAVAVKGLKGLERLEAAAKFLTKNGVDIGKTTSKIALREAVSAIDPIGIDSFISAKKNNDADAVVDVAAADVVTNGQLNSKQFSINGQPYTKGDAIPNLNNHPQALDVNGQPITTKTGHLVVIANVDGKPTLIGRDPQGGYGVYDPRATSGINQKLVGDGSVEEPFTNPSDNHPSRGGGNGKYSVVNSKDLPAYVELEEIDIRQAERLEYSEEHPGLFPYYTSGETLLIDLDGDGKRFITVEPTNIPGVYQLFKNDHSADYNQNITFTRNEDGTFTLKDSKAVPPPKAEIIQGVRAKYMQSLQPKSVTYFGITYDILPYDEFGNVYFRKANPNGNVEMLTYNDSTVFRTQIGDGESVMLIRNSNGGYVEYDPKTREIIPEKTYEDVGDGVYKRAWQISESQNFKNFTYYHNLMKSDFPENDLPVQITNGKNTGLFKSSDGKLYIKADDRKFVELTPSLDSDNIYSILSGKEGLLIHRNHDGNFVFWKHGLEHKHMKEVDEIRIRVDISLKDLKKLTQDEIAAINRSDISLLRKGSAERDYIEKRLPEYKAAKPKSKPHLSKDSIKNLQQMEDENHFVGVIDIRTGKIHILPGQRGGSEHSESQKTFGLKGRTYPMQHAPVRRDARQIDLERGGVFVPKPVVDNVEGLTISKTMVFKGEDGLWRMNDAGKNANPAHQDAIFYKDPITGIYYEVEKLNPEKHGRYPVVENQGFGNNDYVFKGYGQQNGPARNNIGNDNYRLLQKDGIWIIYSEISSSSGRPGHQQVVAMLEDEEKNFLGISGTITKKEGVIGITRLSYRSQSLNASKFDVGNRSNEEAIGVPNFIEQSIVSEIGKRYPVE